jgi:hypothetical protein
MADKVMQFLVANGGGTIDEIVARVSSRPQNIAHSLATLSTQGFLRVTGPKKVEDFSKLVEQVRAKNGYDGEDKLAQRGQVLEEIVQRQPEFLRTVVSPTTRGITFGLS